MKHIYLLTHERELERKSNTGSLVAEFLGECCRIFVWNRVAPDPDLLHKIESESVALLYPGIESVALTECSEDFDSFIIIDATWQEAKKMYNHSSYLKSLPMVNVAREEASIYTLRRNQKLQGLCTAECVCEILKASGYKHQADGIVMSLVHFMEI